MLQANQGVVEEAVGDEKGCDAEGGVEELLLDQAVLQAEGDL